MDKIRLTTKDDDNPIIYRVLTIPGSAGFCPSTVWKHQINLQQKRRNVGFPGFRSRFFFLESERSRWEFLEIPMVIFSGETSTCRNIYASAFFTNIVIVWTKKSYHDCVYQQSLIKTTGRILIRDLFRKSILRSTFLFVFCPARDIALHPPNGSQNWFWRPGWCQVVDRDRVFFNKNQGEKR